MEEIYCKALSLEDKMWVEGYYVKLLTEREEKTEETHIILKNMENSWEIDPSTLCLFTGRYDCTLWEELSIEEQTQFLAEWNGENNRYNEYYDWRGKKIFNNDILLAGGSLMHVFFDKEGLAIKVNEYALHLYENIPENEKLILQEYGYNQTGAFMNEEKVISFALCNTASGRLKGIHKIVGNYLETPELLTAAFYEKNNDYAEKFGLM